MVKKNSLASPTWPIYRRLLGYVKPYWKAFGLAVLGLALAGLTEPILPALMKPLLDNGFGSASKTPLWVVPAALIGLFAVRGLLTFATSYLMTWVGNKVLVDVRREMFARLLQMPASFFNQESAGKLVSRLVFEVNNLTQAATVALTAMVQETLVIIGLLALLLYLNWQLTLVALVLVPFIAWAISFAGKRVRVLSSQSLSVSREMAHVIEEAANGHKVIKIYSGQEREAQRFDVVNEKLRAFARRVGVADAAVTPITQLLASFAVAAVVTIAIYQSRSDQTTVGSFVSFITAMLMLLAPLKRVSNINANLQKGLASAEVVFELLDAQPEQDTGSEKLPFPVHGLLEFRSVDLTYINSERPAIRNLSLKVNPGEVIAIVGASGSGKSSLANLLLRFYEPSSGVVLIDGQDIRSFTLASLRQNIAMVNQDTMLFDDSISANVSFGLGNKAPILPKDELQQRVLTALESAHLLDVVRALPQGVQTPIGDNGNRLSGGQRQRLAIARAIIKDAPILILDEATSALDNESERAVQAALQSLMKGRTTLVVAHRLSTIINADRIIVLDKGQLVEQGTHDELMVRGGFYSRLYSLSSLSQ